MRCVVGAVGRRALGLVCRAIVGARLDARVVGRENVPERGAVLLAARHYHHLYDGCLLIALCPRTPSLLVALDWMRSRRAARALEALCRLARWPVVLRPEAIRARAGSAYRAADAPRYLRRATREATALLQDGDVLLLFPEAYPNIDPSFTPKRGDEMLPFRPGFVQLARRAGQQGVGVAVVPVGIAYSAAGRRRRAVVRFGRPRYLARGGDPRAFLQQIEADVRRLSAQPPGG